ncbi:MetQ/NlpA family ABC transporter substrate-binding protein [Pantoea sp. S18]|uniref:MetQ/NlpA family ABC transporter substrate-binding protein n=1 Tax=Pantoea sp. S18 TaxID=3019892 RepID=UPI0012AD7014|nr:MetQ/NlpA family lipoprotein [Pantoea sp. S18]MEA5101278.1 MetQ/NlpA family lipoprotein [Pantoea sp. S18]MRT43324.1 MetQ/NlpA family lipoprotein [Enterobacteriaceae bacterium RIT702]
MKKILLTTLLAASVALLSGCNKDDENQIKVAINTGPDQALWETVKQVAHDKYQLDVDVVAFNDYVQPNEALFNKDVDANAFQSLPYLEMQSKERGYHFAVVTNTFVFPIAGYSRKIKSLKELPDGATVTISNEATTLGRSLLLLQAQGLIKVKPEAGLLPTTLDITDNPKKLKIVEVDTPQLARTLDDPQVYISIINNNFAALVNLSASRDGMFMEGKASPYVNAIVAREDNKDSPNVQKLKQAFQSQEVLDKANEIYKGDIIKGW